MPRPKKHIHYVYKTTNLITGRYYIGKHSTYYFEDGYLGSGKRLRYEIDKYGRENFKKEILEFCDSKESVAELERRIVGEEQLKDPLCINLKIGGEGGGPPGGFWNEEHRQKFLESNSRGGRTAGLFRGHAKKLESDPEYKKKYGKSISDSIKSRIENGTFVPPFLGRHHSEEAKKKIRESSVGKHSGSKNGMYGRSRPIEERKKIRDSIKGRRCINDGSIVKYVKLEELDSYLSSGWKIGGLKKS